jgi:hypothetical protein
MLGVFTSFDVFGQRYDSSGTPQGGAFQVNTYTTNGQQSPAVATDASGAFLIAWVSVRDGSQYGVFGQHYDSAGVAQGGEFQVNTYTTNLQTSPAVAGSGSGAFVVVWDSRVQESTGFGVFGQRYAELTATPTSTPTNTPTATPTDTPTSTPTVTPTSTGVPNGGSCNDPADCTSGNCVDDTCCDAPSCPPGQSCDNPGNAGMCSADPSAPAPALSRNGVLMGLAVLCAVGGVAVLRRRQGV